MGWCVSAVLAAATVVVHAAPKEKLVPARFADVSDRLGKRWDIKQNGTVNDGQSDCFDTGLTLTVNGQQFNANQPQMTVDGSEYVLSQAPRDKLTVTRRIRVDIERSGARFIESVHNGGKKTKTISFVLTSNLGSTCQSVVTTTGTPFAGQLDKKDVGIFAIQRPGSRPSVLFLCGGQTGKRGVKPQIQVNNNRTIIMTFSGITCPAGATVSVVHWVAQRSAAGHAGLADLVKTFYHRNRLVTPEVPRDLRRSVVNFRSSGYSFSDMVTEDLLEPLNEAMDERGIDLEQGDVLWFGEDNQVVGTLTCDALSIKTAYGDTPLVLGDWGLLQGGSGVGRAMSVHLLSGEILHGMIEAKGFALKLLRDDAVIALGPEAIDTLARKIPERSIATNSATRLVVQLANGDRLLLKPDQAGSLEMLTAWGSFTCPLNALAGLNYTRDPQPGYQVHLRDGGHFWAIIPSRALSALDTERFGTIDIDTRAVRLLQRLEPPVEDAAADALDDPMDAVAHVELINGDLLAGHLASGILRVATGTALHSLNAADIRSLRVEEEGDNERVVTLGTHAGSSLEGTISDQMFTVISGTNRLHVPAAYLLRCWQPVPPITVTADTTNTIAMVAISNTVATVTGTTNVVPPQAVTNALNEGGTP